MLETLITSKTRLKLLLKFFLNPESKGYLRSLESEFKESTNGIRVELNRFEAAGMLNATLDGNKKVFQANAAHPLFSTLQKIIHNYVGLDKIVESVTSKLGEVHSVYLVGELAKGIDAEIIDLVFVGEVDMPYLIKLIEKVEKLVSKRIRYIVYSDDDFAESQVGNKPMLLLWHESNRVIGS